MKTTTKPTKPTKKTKATAPQPKRNPLAELIHDDQQDQIGRTVAVTAFVTRFWQLQGAKFTPQLPGLFFVTPDGTTNPFKTFCDDITDRVGNSIAYLRVELEETPVVKEPKAFTDLKAELFGPEPPPPPFRKKTVRGHPSQSYCKAWDEEDGWTGGENNNLLLNLDQPGDLGQFLADAAVMHSKLIDPWGAGGGIEKPPRFIALTGNLGARTWDLEFCVRIAKLGLAAVSLPHVGGGAVRGADELWRYIVESRVFTGAPPVQPNVHIYQIKWAKAYESQLRARLRYHPAPYEYSMLRVVRELDAVCGNLARVAARGSSQTTIDSLHNDLYALSFRGILISVASMAYHGLGLNRGCDPGKAGQLLDFFRECGTTTRRATQRKYPEFKAADLDRILPIFAAEGLVEIDGTKIRAMGLEEFIRFLYARPEFAEPPLLYKDLVGIP